MESRSIGRSELIGGVVPLVLFLVLLAAISPTVAFAVQADGGSNTLASEVSDAKALQPELTAQSLLSPQENVTFASAQNINLNTGTDGVLTGNYYNPDERWYKFSLPEAGKLRLTMYTASTESSGNWEVYLYDSDEKEIGANRYDLGSTPAQTILDIGLPKGTYYVMVGKGGSVTDIPYRITPGFTASQYCETELNDSLASADSIALDKVTSAAVSSKKRFFAAGVFEYEEADWFEFKMATAGKLALKMSSPATDSNARPLEVRLYDSAKNEICRGQYKVGGVPLQTVLATGLPKGRYFIEISGYKYESDLKNIKSLPYDLMPAFTPSTAWETESNDSLAAADSIAIGKTTEGTKTSRNSLYNGDDDWFKIKPAASGELFLKMDAPAGTETGRWDVTLYDSKNNKIDSGSLTIGEASWKTIIKCRVKRAVYYVKVECRSSLPNSYAYSLKPLLKMDNPLQVKAKKLSASAAKAKKGKQVISAKKTFAVSKAKGKVIYRKVKGDRKIAIASNGKVTLGKGLKKGTYRIVVKITAEGNAGYLPKAKRVTITIRVK
ncbi:MAG TPA: hypothetical protein DCP91_09465 [Eggerthellaceae bacterium]|nr:hypothetical protein [Eggerthellaceae bacterium]